MTYPAPFLRLVVGGDIYAPNEQFTWSMSLFDPAPGPTPVPDEVPSAVADAVRVFHTTANITTQSAALRWIKLNQIGIDGRYTQDTTVRYDYPNPFPVGTAATIVPPQIALAVTLLTDSERGTASRGRFFVPLPARQPSSLGRLAESDALAYANAAAVMVNSINAAMDPYRVVIASDSGTGRFRTVTGVRVGRVLDTIRSRRRSFIEAPVEASTPIAP